MGIGTNCEILDFKEIQNPFLFFKEKHWGVNLTILPKLIDACLHKWFN